MGLSTIFLLLAAALIADVVLSCAPLKEGCFKHDNVNENRLHSDKSEHTGESFHSGVNINWGDFEKYLRGAICRCEKAAAAEGFKYFSIRYFGECYGLKNLPSEKSDFCVHHTFEQCAQRHERCVGAEEAEYVYKVVSQDASCSSIAGTYGNGAAKIDFDKGHLHGKWEKNSRPDFKGTIEANCKGRMRFPDHRVFTLEYDPKLKKIFWDGRNSGNVWTKDASCSSIAGTYGNGAAKIDFDKGHLHGKWEKNSRPDFKGTIEANCKGRMRFPDHRVFTLEYDPKLKKIFWDGRNSGNVWTKDCRYKYHGQGKSCHTNVYTRLRGRCDGWSRTSLEQCKKKCDNNEVPPGCPRQQCKFVIWDLNRDWLPGWCQLATAGCRIGTANMAHRVYEKEC